MTDYQEYRIKKLEQAVRLLSKHLPIVGDKYATAYNNIGELIIDEVPQEIRDELFKCIKCSSRFIVEVLTEKLE